MKVSYIVTKEGDSNALLSSYVQVCTKRAVHVWAAVYIVLFLWKSAQAMYANGPLS